MAQGVWLGPVVLRGASKCDDTVFLHAFPHVLAACGVDMESVGSPW